MSSLCDKCLHVHLGHSGGNGEIMHEQDRPCLRKPLIRVCSPWLRGTIYSLGFNTRGVPYTIEDMLL